MSIRLAVSELPSLLMDVVREAFADQPDVSVEFLPDGDLGAAVDHARPDVMILGAAESDAHWDLLLEYPRMAVLTLSPDARDAWVCELQPHARPLGEVSLAGLRTAVREAAGRHRRR
ncbi:hypothetical protein [Cryptosporangium minutisporangium]|uniref:hypothetical protein n=1 Tax=Cryptosporangium minutisporangium TaxID=113569 RepID=UPI0031E8E788